MSNDFSKQVAELIEDAFKNLRKAAKVGARSASTDSAMVEAESLRLHAGLQVGAAQAAATLHLANEVRTVALLLTATSPSGASVELAREAYTAAVIHLGLVAEEPDTSTVDALRKAGLYPDGEDPADQDVEL